jgi:hypothetical protein
MSHDRCCKVIKLPNELGLKSWELVEQAAMSVHYLAISARHPENGPLATVRPH